MNYPQFRFTYLRERPCRGAKKGFPVGCVAMVIDKEANEVGIGVATCHPTDKKNDYSKAMMKHLAVGRLMLDRQVVPLPPSVKDEFYSSHDILCEVFFALQQDHSLPARARKAINRWIAEVEDRVEEEETAPAVDYAPPSTSSLFGGF